MAVRKIRVESVSMPTNRRNRERLEALSTSPEEKERAKGRKEYYDRALSVKTPREYFGKNVGQPVRGVKEIKVKNESRRVSYNNKINGPQGTYYDQRLTITRSDLENINLAINDEIKNDYPNVGEYAFGDRPRAMMYLKPLRVDEKGIAYLTITQIRFIKRVLGDLPRLKDTSNAYIIVRENRRTNNEDGSELDQEIEENLSIIENESWDFLQDRDMDESGSKGVWDYSYELADKYNLDQESLYNALQEFKEEIIGENK